MRSRVAWAKLLAEKGVAAAPPPAAPQRPASGLRGRELSRAAPAPRSPALPPASPLAPEVQVLAIRAQGKPTMVSSDRYRKRPAVLRYRAYADHLRLLGALLPESYLVIAYFAMPASWSGAERGRRHLTPHQVKPDGTNILKGVEDVLCPRGDQQLFDGRFRKVWAASDRMVIIDTRARPISEIDVAEWAPSNGLHMPLPASDA